MDKLNKHDVVVAAIEKMNSCQFKATGLKVELEAQFNRGVDDNRGDCSYCDEGFVTCENCSGDGYWICDQCDGEGTYDNDEGIQTECGECAGNGRIDCDECDGGSYTCGECEGDWQGEEGDSWGSELVCQDWLLERLEQYGLSEKYTDEDGEEHYKAKLPLVYFKFYHDGSVDSEATFTLSTKNPQAIYDYLPKIIEAWKQLGEVIGNGMDTRGAGMHMAVLNTKNAYYHRGNIYNGGEPSVRRTGDRTRFLNFRRSMTLLLPALYFLSSSCEETRELHYRTPRIVDSENEQSRYGAINFGHGALEFRIFDTCYDNPEQILDNIVVISRALRYWTTKYTKNNLSGIANNIRFGVDGSRKLTRFYICQEHISLLNAGLKLLKPSYYTIGELKKQRNFCVNQTQIKNAVTKVRKDAVKDYVEYEERFKWSLELRRHELMYSKISDKVNYGTFKGANEELLAKLEADAEKDVAERAKTKKTVDKYIEEKVSEFNNRSKGAYALSV